MKFLLTGVSFLSSRTRPETTACHFLIYFFMSIIIDVIFNAIYAAKLRIKIKQISFGW